ncbi:MAG TPA: hypothetical protein VMF69_24995 [Gemmataceae bacterium]|nr:hypothetical protein [Gemmataceae bacterium]
MRPPVFLPHNEPYLGHPTLLELDQAIPPAMQTHARLAQATFNRELSPVEKAAAQLVPQAVSIALSIRELIRQGYLFSAALLLRPLVERVGTVEYLRVNPGAVEAWHAGWPRKGQPCLQELLEAASQAEAVNPGELRYFANVLHKLIHPDPTGGLWNMINREDGRPAFSSGKILEDPQFCDFVSVTASRFLGLVTRIAVDIFEQKGSGV